MLPGNQALIIIVSWTLVLALIRLNVNGQPQHLQQVQQQQQVVQVVGQTQPQLVVVQPAQGQDQIQQQQQQQQQQQHQQHQHQQPEQVQLVPIIGNQPNGVTLAMPPSLVLIQPNTPQTGEQIKLGTDEVCGLNMKELRHDSRIVGGRPALRAEVPFIVHLRESHVFRMLGYNKCGGCIINHRWAITAAHCKPAFFSSLEIILGKHKTFEDAPPPEGSAIAAIIKSGKGIFGSSSSSSSSKPIDPLDPINENLISDPTNSSGRRQPILQVLAETVIVHPDYDSKTLENDLALIKMKKPIPFRDDIQPICLPNKNEDFTGLDGYATGWGLTHFDKRQLPESLQIVRLPIISNKRCQAMYRKAGHDKQITDMDLCAGYAKGGMDACEGDSGGPLIVRRPHDRRWILAGIVSNGVKCGEPLLPGVYTRVSKFMDWIEEQMRIHS